jgi:hypothetical protein
LKKNNGWIENKKWVNKTLEEHGTLLKEISEKIGGIKEDIAGLKVKSGIWGLIGGAIPVGITMTIMAIRGWFGKE